MDLRTKLLNSLVDNDGYKNLRILDENKQLEKIIPDIIDMKKVGECKYHVVNCFEHSMYALEEFENIIKMEDFFSGHLKTYIYDYLSTKIENNIEKKLILKLGILFHDIGKPECETTDELGRKHFRNHEKVGAQKIEYIGRNLEIGSNATQILFNYVRYHMTLLSLYKTNDLSQNKLYEIFDILKDDIIGVVILGYVDIVSTRKLLNPNEDSKILITYVEYIITNYLYRYKRRKK